MKRSVMAIGLGYVVYAALNMAQVMVMMNFMAHGALSVDTVAGRIAYWIGDVVIGGIAGYVAAMIAGRDEVKHGALLGAVMLVIQLLSIAAYLGSGLVWQTGAGFLLTVIAPTAGGWLRAWQKESKGSDSSGFSDLGGLG